MKKEIRRRLAVSFYNLSARQGILPTMNTFQKQRLRINYFFVALLLVLAHASNLQAEPIKCEFELGTEFGALLDEHKLSDLLQSDFINEHPYLAMNGPQRMLAAVLSAGVEQRRSPNGLGTVNYYKLFSEGGPLTNGRKIIARLTEIEQVVSYLKEKARGTTHGKFVPLLEGGAATGKTEFAEIWQEALANLSRNSPEHYVYTFEFVGLDKITGLEKLFKNLKSYASPIYENPLALLPKEARNKLVLKAKEKVLELSGVQPRPSFNLTTNSTGLRDAIIQHYALIAKKEGKKFTGKDAFAALDKHVKLKRVVWGGAERSLPIIGYQGDDVDWGNLVGTPNLLVQTLQGQGHYLSYDLNGLITQGNGSMITLDELFRNGKDMMEAMHDLFWSSKIGVNGVPEIPLDMFILAATNTENVEASLNDNGRRAMMSRIKRIPFGWLTSPHDVAHVQLLMIQVGSGEKVEGLPSPLQMKELKTIGSSDAETDGEERQHSWQDADLKKLFPAYEGIGARKGPDRRYALSIQRGDERVHVAPHTFLYMSSIASLSRMSFDAQGAHGLGDGFKVINTNVYRNRAARLRWKLGKEQPTEAHLGELIRLSKLQKEGSFGIGSRPFGKWVKKCLDAAESAGNSRTLTPQLARSVLLTMLDGEELEIESNEDRLYYKKLIELADRHFLFPEVQADVVAAAASNSAVAKKHYEEFIQESLALSRDPDAKKYTDLATSQVKTIDMKRRIAVQELYLKDNGRPIDVSQIAQILSFSKVSGKDEADESLLAAVNSYLAGNIFTNVASLQGVLDFEETGDGNEGTRETADQIRNYMINHLGYNAASYAAALQIANEMKNRGELN